MKVLSLWATCNRVIPQVWRDLFTTVLESGPQLQRRTWLKVEVNTIEQKRARAREISLDQLMGVGDYTIEMQYLYYGPILALCYAVTLNTWDRIK